ncbi:unnamed protein product [Amoebophrya sp. A25]|nr:unnamed protein product [Amoebophrya sp. A25]|eukprot:GSA25T00025244001.1
MYLIIYYHVNDIYYVFPLAYYEEIEDGQKHGPKPNKISQRITAGAVQQENFRKFYCRVAPYGRG